MNVKPYLIMAVCILTCSCGGSRHNDEIHDSAMELARHHALLLDESRHDINDHYIQSILLHVKAKEHQMRQYGLNDAADTYIDEFRKNVTEINDSLAQIIF